MELIAFIIVGVVMAAAFIYLEYKFAKMNNAEEERLPGEVHKILEKLGAWDIVFDGHQWFRFRIEDDLLWLNIANAPLIEVILQNSTEGCDDPELAKQIGAEMTSQLGCGRVVLQDEGIFIGWSSIVFGEEGIKEGLPKIINYLLAIRENYVARFEKALKAKQSETNTADK